MVAGLQAKADQLGLPFGSRTMTYNSRLAQELGLWADDQGNGHAFHMAAFHAYFAQGKNIARREILLELADDAGLPRNEADTVLAERSYLPLVDKDWQRSRDLGITAVPTFVLGQDRLVGAQSYQTLAQFLATHNIAPRTDVRT